MNDENQPSVSFSPETEIIGTSNSPTPKRKRLLLIIGAVFVLLIVLIGAAIVIMGGMKKNATTAFVAHSSFNDWLKPASELKIGGQRYVSACQVLPEETYNEIFGPMPGTSVVKEEYFDESLPTSRFSLTPTSPETMCEFNSNPLSNVSLSLKLSQLSDPYDFDDIGRSSNLTNRGSSVKKILDEYASLKGLDNNQQAKTFVATMRKSLDTYNRLDASDQTLPDNSLENAILPDDNPYVEGFSFKGVHKNLVMTLTHRPKSSDPKSMSDKDKVTELARMQQAFTTIRQNADLKDISQSPSATIRTASNKVGEAVVLEPCRVLDAAAFTTGLGIPQNDNVERTSLPLDTTTVRLRRDKSTILPENQCTRNYNAGKIPTGYTLTPAEEKYQRAGYASIDLAIGYAKTGQQAQQVWQEDAPGSRPLATSADVAVVWGEDTLTGANFRVGDYICSVNIDEVKSAAAFEEFVDIPTPDSAYVPLINKLVENIKALQTQKQ